MREVRGASRPNRSRLPYTVAGHILTKYIVRVERKRKRPPTTIFYRPHESASPIQSSEPIAYPRKKVVACMQISVSK